MSELPMYAALSAGPESCLPQADTLCTSTNCTASQNLSLTGAQSKGLKWMHLLCATHTLASFGAISAQMPARCSIEVVGL